MSKSLPVIEILRSVMTVQSYLRSATSTTLPPVIARNAQYAALVTQFEDWQQDLWAQFWEGLVAAGVSGESAEVNSLFQDQVSDETAMHGLLYDGSVPIVVSQCNDVANLISNAQPVLQQLQTIAKGIEDADQQAVDQYTSLVDTLQDQFSSQEDTLTKDALDSATDVVSTAVEVMLAVGTEGEASAPLAKGVVKLGTDAVDELVLTGEINQTLGQLESAWQALDQASADLAQITLLCNQLEAVTDEAAGALAALTTLSTDWDVVAQTTQSSADDWNDGGSASLEEWAAEMVKLSFGNATQNVSAASAS